jgi:hypothetical protein
MIGKNKIKEAFWQAVRQAGVNDSQLKQGVKIVFEFNNQLYWIDTESHYSDLNNLNHELENRAMEAVLYKQHPDEEMMKELYKQQNEEKQQENKWSEADKLFIASCFAMNGILSHDTRYIKMDYVADDSIKQAKKLLTKLNE